MESQVTNQIICKVAVSNKKAPEIRGIINAFPYSSQVNKTAPGHHVPNSFSFLAAGPDNDIEYSSCQIRVQPCYPLGITVGEIGTRLIPWFSRQINACEIGKRLFAYLRADARRNWHLGTRGD
jgi:hypothetical protein